MTNDIDIDEPTLAIIRANDAKLRRLQDEVAQASGDEERRLIVEFIECVKSQEAVPSEVPGLEDRARKLAEARTQAVNHYGLSD